MRRRTARYARRVLMLERLYVRVAGGELVEAVRVEDHGQRAGAVHLVARDQPLLQIGHRVVEMALPPCELGLRPVELRLLAIKLRLHLDLLVLEARHLARDVVDAPRVALDRRRARRLPGAVRLQMASHVREARTT